MKKMLLIVFMSCFSFACKTTSVATTNSSTGNRAAADTALQGDRLKDVTKP